MFDITHCKGFHMTFANGWTISVQWGAGNYSDNYSELDYDTLIKGSKTAEIAAWDPSHNWHDFSDCERVKGYQTPDQVLAFMVEIAGRPAAVHHTLTLDSRVRAHLEHESYAGLTREDKEVL